MMRPTFPNERRTAQYRQLMEKGVGKVESGKRSRIAIVGAGMAGLVAGWLLKEAGHTIRIYEANNIVGGRIKTLRERFTSGLYAEAGAMRIPKDHGLTMWLVNDFKLPTYDGTGQHDNCLVYINGQRCTYREYRQGKDLGLALKKGEEGKTGELLFKEAYEKYIRPTKEDWKKWDKWSLRDFLMDKAQLSLAAIDLIGIELGHETNLSISLLEATRDAEDTGTDTKVCHIKDGMDHLPRAFTEAVRNTDRPSRNLTNELRYHARVIEIRRDRNKFRLKYENPVTHAQQTRKFHYVVITIPFSALRRC